MKSLFASGLIFDVVLAVIVLELTILSCYGLWRRQQLVSPDVYANLIAAAGLLAAMHVYIADGWWVYTGLSLTVALAAHVVGLALRRQDRISPGAAKRYDRTVSRVQFSGGR